jgi:hypothetical protein
MTRRRPLALALATLACTGAALAAPAAHAAAAKPGVTTGAVANLAPTSATLLGSVRPNGAATTYAFEYGPTTKYGATTGSGQAGSGRDVVAAATAVAGLAPNTVYHYRLVARNVRGTVRGADRSFRTRPQPLGLSLTATPNPVRFGASVTLSGALAGTGTAGRQVVLQANPFPFVQGFQRVANPQVVNASGAYAFPVLALTQNTQFRSVVPGTAVVSPIVTAAAAVRVRTRVTHRRVRRGRTIRFSGAVRPKRDAARVGIQKLNRKGVWVTVAGTRTHSGGAGFSIFAKRVRIRRGGQYRAFVEITDGSVASAPGRTIRVRSFRRR